ncbi:MAG: hypothetical protein ACTHWH_05880 [Marinobacter sp.]
MNNLKDAIESDFYKGDMDKPIASDVGELIEQLKRLPRHLPVNHGFGEGCSLTVYNIKDGAFLEIGECDE